MNKLKQIILAIDSDDEGKILGNVNPTDSKPQHTKAGNIKSSDYVSREPEGRFEQPKPNIIFAQVAKEFTDEPGQFKPIRQRTRRESRTAFGRFIMDKFFIDYPDFAGKVNFEAIVEAANISAELKEWYAVRRSEWTNMVQFPDWAVEKLANDEFETVQDKLSQIGEVRRAKATMESNVAKHSKELMSRIRQNSLLRLDAIFKKDDGTTDWLAIIFSLTVENLPMDRIFDIVRYRVADASKSDAEINDESYLSPMMYEDKVLDTFKKECFGEWQHGKSLEDYFKRVKVNLTKYDKSHGDGDLSNIKEIVLGKDTGKV